MSNFRTGAFDSVLRGARDAARGALPQQCALCSCAAGIELVCGACVRDLPWLSSVCPVCALPTNSGSVCGRCLSEPPPYDATTAAFSYRFPIDRLIHSLKYQSRLALAEWCADAILSRAEHARQDPDALSRQRLVALPLAVERQRERGYNQAQEIARTIAARTGIALLGSALLRVRATPPQAALPYPSRAKNVRGAFACDADLAGLTIVVVDDVMTTGASLAEAGRVLKRAGAARVENWVVARTMPPL